MRKILLDDRVKCKKELIQEIEKMEKEERWRNIEGVPASDAISIANNNAVFNEGLQSVLNLLK